MKDLKLSSDDELYRLKHVIIKMENLMQDFTYGDIMQFLPFEVIAKLKVKVEKEIDKRDSEMRKRINARSL